MARGGRYLPNVGVVAFLSETRSYGSALFLHDSSLVCDGLGRPYVPNELLDCLDVSTGCCLIVAPRSNVRELIVLVVL